MTVIHQGLDKPAFAACPRLQKQGVVSKMVGCVCLGESQIVQEAGCGLTQLELYRVDFLPMVVTMREK